MSSHGWFDSEALPLAVFDKQLDPLAWFDPLLVGFDDRRRVSQSSLSWFDKDVVSLAIFDPLMDPLAWFGDGGGPDDFPTLSALGLSLFAMSPYAGSPFYNFASAGSSTTRRLVYRSGNPAPTIGTTVNGRASAYYDSTAADSTDPATQAMSGLWRAVATGGAFPPWVGLASAGTSLGEDLTTLGVAPVAGTPVNGYDPVDFNGITQAIHGDLMSAFVTTTAWTACFVFLGRTAEADPGAGNRFGRPAVFCDSSAYFIVAFTDSGISLEMANGTDPATSLTAACPANVWHFVRCGYDGANYFLQVDNGTLVTEAYNVTGQSLGGSIQVGCNYNETAHLDGKILDFEITPTVLSSTIIDGIARDAQIKYGQNYGF